MPCPFCNGLMYDRSVPMICTPIHCASCGRTGWVYDELLDAHTNWDDYYEQFSWVRSALDARKAVTAMGCPEVIAHYLVNSS